MKHQRLTVFYQSVKKFRFRVESKVNDFKKQCGDKGRNQMMLRSGEHFIKRRKSSGKIEDSRPKPLKQEAKIKFEHKLETSRFNESIGPDFKIYEYDDFLASSSPVQGPPLPPRYSSSAPPPLIRRKNSFRHNSY